MKIFKQYLATSLAAAATLLAPAIASAVEVPYSFSAISETNPDANVIIEDASFDTEVTGPGFEVRLLEGSYGYKLTLTLGYSFAQQTGLIGYAVDTKVENPGFVLNNSSADFQTFRSAITNGGWYRIDFTPLAKSINATQPLMLRTPSVSSPVPEPESMLLMATGLIAVMGTARRRQRCITMRRRVLAS